MVGIAVVLLGAGLWIYKVLYLSTGGALERAESFRFQRMTVAQMGEQGAFRFFYVTNRSQTPGDGPPEERFGRSRAAALKNRLNAGRRRQIEAAIGASRPDPSSVRRVNLALSPGKAGASRHDELSVAQVGTDLGIWDLGRFAARYRELFGELPSRTLRRRG